MSVVVAAAPDMMALGLVAKWLVQVEMAAQAVLFLEELEERHLDFRATALEEAVPEVLAVHKAAVGHLEDMQEIPRVCVQAIH